ESTLASGRCTPRAAAASVATAASVRALGRDPPEIARYGCRVATKRARKTPQPLPPPLPPGTRTVGQLVAEAIRLYGRRFWPSFALGVPIGLLGLLLLTIGGATEAIVGVVAGSVLLTLSYVGASVLA